MPTITDETIASSAYDTSGNGGRKIARYYDGVNEYKIFVVKNGTTEIRLYKKLNNDAPVLLSNFSVTSLTDVCIENAGNGYVGILYSHSGSTVSYRTVSVSLGTLGTVTNADTGQSAVGNVTMIADDTKSNMYMGVATKNSTYANSFNIRFNKGSINTDGSVTWGTTEQITKSSGTGCHFQNPSITLKGNVALIFTQTYGFYLFGSTSTGNAGSSSIVLFKRDNTLSSGNAIVDSSWSWTNIITDSSYAQSSPSAIFVPQSINGLANGLIANAWHGIDATHTTTNYIRFSKSTDGGITWSTMQKLVPGTNASLTANKAGKLFITYEDAGVTKRIESSDNGDTWSSAITLGAGTNPSSLFDLTMNMTEPLTIRKGASSVLFSGAWTTTTISVTPGDIGQIQDKNNILSYSITTDGSMSTITEKINGTVVNTRTANSGDAITLGLTQAQWDAIRFGKYVDATGGKNTLTVEMGTDKWTYTFDKQLASDADIISASKAVKDANEVYLPSVKKQLADAINAKGGSVSANADWLTMISGMKTSNSTRTLSGTVTSTSTNYPFVSANGTAVNVPKCTVTGLPFNPSRVLMWNSSTNVQSAMYVKEGLHYFGGLAVATCGANYYRADNISNVLGFVLPVLAPGTVFNWVAYE